MFHPVLFFDSLSEAHLEAVVIKLTSELVVVLGNGLACSGTTLAEHRWQIGGLGVDLLLSNSLSLVLSFKSVRVNDILDGLSSVVDHIVSGDEISPLEGGLLGAMTDDDVVLDTAISIDHHIVVVSIFLLLLYS